MYIQSKEEHYYYTSPPRQKIPLPDDIKEMFTLKPITCAEYTHLTPTLEREIFQRVQEGMQLTTIFPLTLGHRAEKLAAIDSPWSRWSVSVFQSIRRPAIEGGLSQVLNWDIQRGRDFLENVAHFVYCCDGYADQNLLTAAKMDKWLSRVDPPGEQFKRDMSDRDRSCAQNGLPEGSKRIAPVEFVFIG
ncbi:hypothetical protein B0H16DRAFT_1317113 [Mycena metata]|uniref:Uncharacterized protein n=1 Tax=Mycena metata TaxID=1033252 RepID=A0AAD7IZA2_9AGAR|nr:hypothetical protein B0H16DRAFT_1317113 [Mycena metata]